uniref:Uncharacterized protein n=1 Tax=Rhizobium leguminosarum TaxID=384 RepID=A0A179BZ69_RHILE|nr:hypothetical protein A4U53_37860 [Rhizobium leguminosarum]
MEVCRFKSLRDVVDEHELGFAIVANLRNVRARSGKLARMTSCHCQPLSRADGDDEARQVISVKADGIEHSHTKAQLLAFIWQQAR